METLRKGITLLLLGSILTAGLPNGILVALASGETIFSEDFETGWGDWYPDNGVWEVGAPADRSERAYRGEIWAATILDGDYPGYQDSRLISPLIALPTVQGDERIQLSLWHWFNYSSLDSGTVQISAYNATTSQWEEWKSLCEVSGDSAVWSPLTVDLTAQAGTYVRIAFLHTAGRNAYGHVSESWGWYIEELEIRKGTPVFQNPEGFESGWGDWYAENGIWEVGTPTSGPSEAFAGNAVAGTVLDGDYPGYTGSRLVSPRFRVPELAELPFGIFPELTFRHWFSYSSLDSGTVQVSVYDLTTGTWGNWANLTSVDGVSGIWSPMRVDLTAYAGDDVRIAFQHTAGRNAYGHASESSGWYIDDVQIPEGDKEIVLYDFPLDSDPEWDMEGQWEYGVPAGRGGEDHGHSDFGSHERPHRRACDRCQSQWRLQCDAGRPLCRDRRSLRPERP